MIERLQADYDERGVRLYAYKANHVADVYGVFRKWAALNRASAGHASWHQLVQQLYDGKENRADAMGVITSVRNWARDLQRLGLLDVREHKNERGQSDGIWWALPSDAVSARSSAGSSVGCQVRRRPETPKEAAERSLRPWCRRSGRRGVGRFEIVPPAPPPPRSLFSGSTVSSPIAPAPAPTGLGGRGVQLDVTRAAPAALATGSQDAGAPGSATRSGRAGPAVPLAETTAARQKRQRPPQPDRSAELAEALQAFERRFGRPSLPVSPRTWEVWQRAARRGDLYGGFGVPVPRLALQFVLDRMADWRGAHWKVPNGQKHGADMGWLGDVKRRRVDEPQSIAYFVALLDDASKHWRHAYRHEHGLCRRPELCRANAWMYPAFSRRLRNRDKWVAYDREQQRVRRLLNDAGYAAEGSA